MSATPDRDRVDCLLVPISKRIDPAPLQRSPRITERFSGTTEALDAIADEGGAIS